MKTRAFDYVVVGGGIAGLAAAYRLSEKASVCILTKGKIRESSTTYAQGGIAVALPEDDTPFFHYQDTLAAGDGLCDPESVKVLVEDGPERVRQLIEMGARFDLEKDGFHYTREGAHGRRRILHAADATGREIEKTLGAQLQDRDTVTFWQNAEVIDLCMDQGVCVGCLVFSNNELTLVAAKAVFLATGGAGQIYAHCTNPPVSTGDGMALAYRAGAVLRDLEFVQFHPTTLYSGDKQSISIFLISEAVRGEGAVLRNAKGQRFMQRYHSAAELAPRDVVSRAILQEMKDTQSPCVYLDLTQVSVDVQTRFPTIFSRCLESQIDITKDFIPVTPAAHYFMGGVHTDLNGFTGICGLYAVGEVSSFGIHGANRLASNSLLDGLVFGFRAAESALSSDLKLVSRIPYEKSWDLKPFSSEWVAIRQQIRVLMWQHVGILRHKKGLLFAESELARLTHQFASFLDVAAAQEVGNMLLVAQLVTRFALAREESRGAHFREDFSKKDDERWRGHLNLVLGAEWKFEPIRQEPVLNFRA